MVMVSKKVWNGLLEILSNKQIFALSLFIVSTLLLFFLFFLDSLYRFSFLFLYFSTTKAFCVDEFVNESERKQKEEEN